MVFLSFLAANWLILLIGIIVLGYVGVSIYKFSKLPINEKYSRIRAYLLYVVTIAEEKWGAGMGAVKLGEVYDAFTKKYPIIKIFISWETFKNLVDSALVEMRKILEVKAIKEAEAAASLAELTPAITEG